MAQISRPRTGHDIHGRDDMTTGFGGTVQEIGVLIQCGFFLLLNLKMVEQNLKMEIKSTYQLQYWTTHMAYIK